MNQVKCISNENYSLSLTIGKKYKVVPDDNSKERIRVIDNSGESYLYPPDLFETVIQKPRVKKLSMADNYKGLADSKGKTLYKDSADKTFESCLPQNVIYELISFENSTDKYDVPAICYYYEADRRDYTLYVYADNSWVLCSD